MRAWRSPTCAWLNRLIVNPRSGLNAIVLVRHRSNHSARSGLHPVWM